MPQLAVVEIVDAKVQERKLPSGGIIRSQIAYLQTGPRESMEIELPVDRDFAGYQAGKYYIGAGTFDRDRFRRLALRPYTVELVPVSGVKLG